MYVFKTKKWARQDAFSLKFFRASKLNVVAVRCLFCGAPEFLQYGQQ